MSALSVSALSRTSSMSSDDSNISYASYSTTSDGRRTRRRFSAAQLTALEHLYHQNAHPTREQRERVAREAELEPRSVTIWFQNKRQTDRKIALHNATNRTRQPQPLMRHSSLPIKSATTAPALARTHSFSLDSIASRSELHQRTPRTPTRTKPFNPNIPIWENMLSSPPESPASPPRVKEVEYVEFGRKNRMLGAGKRLEWACAAARLSGKQNGFARMWEEDEEAFSAGDRDDLRDMDIDEETEEEGDVSTPSISPESSFSESDFDAFRHQQAKRQFNADDDAMEAALALCGLGGRTQ